MKLPDVRASSEVGTHQAPWPGNGVWEALMKFFIPVQDARIAEESYQSIKKFIEKQTGWPISDMRYYEIHYRHNDQDLSARRRT
jgi:hypothetical protein